MSEPVKPAVEAVRDSTNAVSLTDEDGVRQILQESIVGLWDVVNRLTRLRPSRHERYRVTIFGSARAKPGRSATSRPGALRHRWRR
jgi:hypothetical protein